MGSGRGVGLGEGEGPCAGAAPPLRAAQPFAFSPRGGRLHLRPPPSPSQDGKTALDNAKEVGNTEVVLLLLRLFDPAAADAMQAGRAAYRAHPSLSFSPIPSLSFSPSLRLARFSSCCNLSLSHHLVPVLPRVLLSLPHLQTQDKGASFRNRNAQK